MKVLMFGWEFPPFNSGGLGTACYGLTKGLSNKGVDIIFVLPKSVPVNADFLKIIFGDSIASAKKHYIFNSLLHPYITSASYNSRLSAKGSSIYGANLFEEVNRYSLIAEEIAKQENFDIIHSHDWLTFKSGIAAKKVSHKPLVVHVHATEFDRTGGNGINQYVYEIERHGMHEADLIIAVSNYTKNKIVEHYGVSPEKIRVVHNSVEFENYTLEQASKLKENNKIVLFLGRITLQKGPDYFIYAAKKVLEHYPNTIFVVAGSGDMEKQIIEKVAELGISDKVLFAGFLRGKDVHQAYQMADLYVMPSVSEPFGITPLESIINGTPVLISKQSGVSEVLSHCLKVDFWDILEMSNKIVSVLQYPELHTSLKENGKREIQRFSWDKSAERCLNVYNEALNFAGGI
ncbi:glycosyltransferase family 4 protein [Candidatus Pacearchaeota archaeon]|nr:glycosyltransferase family 4 protein [Candidatus Pacearchaeota archaeon]